MVVSPLYMYLQDVPLTYFFPRFHRIHAGACDGRCACDALAG